MVGHASGVTSASPRRMSAAATSRRFSATRLTGPTEAYVVSRLCRPRITTGRVSEWPSSWSRSPRARVPVASVPVTTVPEPVTVNERSTHKRTRPVVVGEGTPARTASSVARNSSRPVPSVADTVTAGAACSTSGSGQAPGGSGRARRQPVARTPGQRG